MNNELSRLLSVRSVVAITVGLFPIPVLARQTESPVKEPIILDRFDQSAAD